MTSNFEVIREGIGSKVLQLKKEGYSALNDAITSEEEVQVLISDKRNKNYWLISKSLEPVSLGMIKSIESRLN